MSIDSKLVSRLKMIYQQKDILKQQEDSIMQEITKCNLENKEQIGEFVFELKNIESELYSKNAYELIPFEKISQLISEKIAKGDIDIKDILQLLTKEEADIVKKGLELNGAIKKNATKKLLVTRQKKV